MKTYTYTLPDGDQLHIEAEPVSSLVIYVNDQGSLHALQEYTQAYGVQWKYENEGSYYLLLPCGTWQQCLRKSADGQQEISLIHLPGGGILEHQCVLHPSLKPCHPQADAWKVSTISLFRLLD